eukprot:c40452_g1_i1.p1 GENE.c40452_g1_i1~~c40452_g1_i1.p1  ORF type:complete len:382 (-),score=79.79 c40452_g1_i1:114-1223(-)
MMLGWTPHEVGEWLQSIHLGHATENVIQQHIDGREMDSIVKLNDTQALSELGLGPADEAALMVEWSAIELRQKLSSTSNESRVVIPRRLTTPPPAESWMQSQLSHAIDLMYGHNRAFIDLPSAQKLLSSLAAHHHPIALGLLARLTNHLKETSTSRHLFSLALQNALEERAKQHDSTAEFLLGYAFDFGLGLEQNYKDAVKWYQRSAIGGSSLGQNNLAVMFDLGRGVAVDHSEAVVWYRKSAEQGNARAQHNLGFMYEEGYGVAPSNEIATYWYLKGAEQGDAGGQNNLGVLIEVGRTGGAASESLAWYWYNKGALQKNGNSLFNLGDLYESGRGVERDLDLAIVWYREAAAQGNESACERLRRLGAL